MTTIRAYLGVAGLTDVVYQFYTQNISAGIPFLAPVVDEGDGWYSVTVPSLPGDHVRWSSPSDPTALARGDNETLAALTGTIRANLGTAGLTDVGYRFYSQNTPETARISTGIVDETDGWYSAAGITLKGDNVRWDSLSDPSAAAREDLTQRYLLIAGLGVPVTIPPPVPVPLPEPTTEPLPFVIGGIDMEKKQNSVLRFATKTRATYVSLRIDSTQGDCDVKSVLLESAGVQRINRRAA